MQERNPCSGCGRERRMMSTNAAVSSRESMTLMVALADIRAALPD